MTMAYSTESLGWWIRGGALNHSTGPTRILSSIVSDFNNTLPIKFIDRRVLRTLASRELDDCICDFQMVSSNGIPIESSRMRQCNIAKRVFR